MSGTDELDDLDLGSPRPRRHEVGRRAFGCLAVLLALAVVVAIAVFGYTHAVSALKDRLSPPADYAGEGSGRVVVEVDQGDVAADIGSTLKAKGVVESVDAFTEAARDNPQSVNIQVGFYALKHKMSSASALAVLIDPANRISSNVVIPEGLRSDQIVDRLAAKTSFSRSQFEKVLKKPGTLGLPSYAGGKVEGYLFPATYEVTPSSTPRSILRSMVRRSRQEADTLGLVKKSKALGYTPHQVMTVASIVQAEGRLSSDFPKIAEVLYNRLEDRMPLQLDTTIAFIFKTSGTLTTTDRQRSVHSPYNTYRNTGLPPTPISSPGATAIKAALNPTRGPWLYFVTTNPSNGKMSFATSYAQHQRNVAKFRAYCRSHDC